MTKEMRRLCLEHTNLSEDDILEIDMQVQRIKERRLYPNLDVFIDIIDTYTGEAVVVYQRRPLEKPSLYSRDIVGEIAKRSNEPAVYRTMETALNSVDLLARSQEGRLMRQKVYPIRNNQKNIAVLILEEWVDEDTLAQNKSPMINQASILKRDDFIIDKIDTAILYFNEAGLLYKINPAGEVLYKKFGYLEKIINLHYDNLSLDFSTFEQIMYFKTLAQNTSSMEREVFFDNSYFDVKYIFMEQSLGFIMMMKDITEIKLKEEEIIHKSVAIREIHHRVKNNLQSIISLLRIQARRCQFDDARKVLDESVNRIMAIARTHELLSKQLEDNIHLEEVLTSVVNNLVRSYSENRRITVTQTVDPTIFLESDQTVTVALVVNELVQNCYNHAFKGRDTGSIQISAGMEERNIMICVQDDGIGYDVTNKKEMNFGLEIIKSYVEDKLRGTLATQSDSTGTRTTIKFKP